MDIRIATRKSALALWQAEHVASLLRQLPAAGNVDLVPLSTRGDEVLDRSLQKIGGKGLFIKELEAAIQAGAADIAVHSMKDVPAEMPDGFCIAAVLERANHSDALVCAKAGSLDELSHGARVGSSSLRRQAQLRILRADLIIEPLRGNVNTRIAKLDSGEYDAVVLAAAGLERLGLQSRISQQFAVNEMLPAVAQGVIGIECLSAAGELQAVVARLNHARTALTTAGERAIAQTLGASCHSPVAAHAVIDNGFMSISAFIAMPDGSRALRDSVRGAPEDAAQLGRNLAAELLDSGAGEILAELEAADD